jgi:acetone carboxylase gamma subunit
MEKRTVSDKTTALAGDYTAESLRQIAARMDREASALRWEETRRTAKYLCPDCGGPDSWHTRDCPTDTSE